MEIKTLIIVASIACIACSLVSVGLTYKYTSQHYELQISNEHLKQQTELAKLNAKVVAKERENNEITASLNEQALASSKAINAMQTKLSAMRTNTGGVLVSANCRNSPTGDTNRASSVDSSTIAAASSGMCELPELLATRIEETAVAADEFRLRAETCKLFADEIVKQRSRLSNDNK